MLKKALKLFSQNNKFLLNKSFLILLVAGILSWSITMIKSGLTYPFGIGFWGANGHDGIWHISLARSLVRDNFQMPIFAGEDIKNYHLGFDGVLNVLNRATNISSQSLYFQVIPPVLAILIGVGVYKFVYRWKESRNDAFWSTLFVFFGGSFGWVVTLLRNGRFDGESMFWSQQSISTLINPPFAFSLAMIFAGLVLLIKFRNMKGKISTLITFLIVFNLGILIFIKVYAGLLFLGALFVSSVFDYIRNKNSYLLKVFAGSFVVSLFFFLPSSGEASSLIVFKPFWFLETMMGLSDRFYWPKFYEAMMNYKLGLVWYKLIPAYLIAFAIFLIGNLGTRIIGIKYFFDKLKDFKSVSWIDVFVFTIIAEGIVVPLFFLQSGTPWNTIQFFYYSLIFSGIIAGISISQITKNKNTKVFGLISLIVIVLTIPTTISTLNNVYLPSRPPAKISTTELEALNFLENQPHGVVLTYNFDEHKAKQAIDNPPRPLYFYESTAYVSAYSNKPVYMEDQVNLDITGYDWPSRKERIYEFVTTNDKDQSRKFLEANNIKYLYLVKELSPLPGEILKVGPTQLGVANIFENNEVVIYRVN